MSCITPEHFRKNSDGYNVVKWSRRVTRVHRLVWFISYGEIPAGMVVAHACNNKACVNLEHLYLTTAAQNNTDAADDGLYRTSDKGNTGKRALTSDEVICIHKSYHEDKVKQVVLAEKYGVRFNTISQVIRGITYKELYKEYHYANP